MCCVCLRFDSYLLLNDTDTTQIDTDCKSLSLHVALPITYRTGGARGTSAGWRHLGVATVRFGKSANYACCRNGRYRRRVGRERSERCQRDPADCTQRNFKSNGIEIWQLNRRRDFPSRESTKRFLSEG